MSPRTASPAPTRLRVPPDVAAQIRAHLEAAYPEEACLILIGRPGTGDVFEARRARNAAPVDRRHRYAVASDVMLRVDREAEAAGLSVVGFVHSHPDHPPVPSATDLELAWPVYVYVIWSVREGRAEAARGWRLEDDRFSEVETDLTGQADRGRGV